MIRTCSLTTIALLLFSYWGLAVAFSQEVKPERFEDEIARFEAGDKENPLEPGGILFVGSSSIRMWELDRSFPELKAINRGFGGSHLFDSIHFAPRIVLPYKPRTIVVYAGDNDIAAGKSPQRVLADFKTFVRTIREFLPGTRIVFIAIKPSIQRWKMVDKMKEANGLIEEYVADEEGLAYVDIFTPMLGEDGQPRKELFLQDGLHLNEKGYEVWTEAFMPVLMSWKK